jgi:hypothetical protein
LLILLACTAKSRSQADDNPFVDLFGATLYKWSPQGDEIMELNTTSLLKGKSAIAVYYSASWYVTEEVHNSILDCRSVDRADISVQDGFLSLYYFDNLPMVGAALASSSRRCSRSSTLP